MKTLINSSTTSIVEFAKRTIYSFQVLIVGIAIPFLFLIGISTTNQDTSGKKTNQIEVKESSNTTEVTPGSAVNLNDGI